MPNFSIYAGPELISRIEARCGQDSEGRPVDRSERVRADLETYYLLLSEARRNLKRVLSTQARGLLCELLEGADVFDAASYRYLPVTLRHELAVGCDSSQLDVKWDVNRAGLEAQLEQFSLTELVALVDAVQAFWRGIAQGKDLKTDNLFD